MFAQILAAIKTNRFLYIYKYQQEPGINRKLSESKLIKNDQIF